MQLCTGKLTLSRIELGPLAWAFDDKAILTIWDNPINTKLSQFQDQTIQLHIVSSHERTGSHELKGVSSIQSSQEKAGSQLQYVPSHEDGKRNCFIPIKIPSKSNTYQIRFHQSFWKAITTIVANFRHQQKQRKAPSQPYWIGPSEEVERAEEAIAYFFRVAEKREWLNGEDLSLTVTLINQNADIDNTLKVICDGIEKSGRIKNDNQFSQILVRRKQQKDSEPAIELRISPTIEE